MKFGQHRGSFFDLPVIGIILFVVFFGIVITYLIGTLIFASLPANMQTGLPATFFNVFLGMNGLLDGILVFVYIGMLLSSAILARQIFSPSPAFWGIGLVLVVVLNFAWVALANTFISFINSSTAFATAAQAFPLMSFIAQHYPFFMILHASILAIAMWGKPTGSSGGYYA